MAPQIVAVTGTNGKTTVSRMIAHALLATGRRVGLTTSAGIDINGKRVAHGDCSGPRSAQRVLATDSLDVAVLETARGGVLRRGFGYRNADVAVVTNITADHLGQDGLHTIDDLTAVKARIAANLGANGALVLNAADPVVAALPARPEISERHPRLRWFHNGGRIPPHPHHGGSTRYTIISDTIVESDNTVSTGLLDVGSVPVTLAGHCSFNVENLLAAVAALRALGLSPDDLAGLRQFGQDENPGRAELHHLACCDVMIDYAHNPAGITAIATATAQLGYTHRICVVGLPGDRTDDALVAAATAVAHGFDSVIVREDANPRGRPTGQTATLIAATIGAVTGMPATIVLDEIEAFRHAVNVAPPGALIVHLADRPADVSNVVHTLGARSPAAPHAAGGIDHGIQRVS